MLFVGSGALVGSADGAVSDITNFRDTLRRDVTAVVCIRSNLGRSIRLGRTKKRGTRFTSPLKVPVDEAARFVSDQSDKAGRFV